ncbi:unnamed protein product [Rhizoctonia solani]|uniref:Uncharacterized protein n=1 Tax=Rhizoctonia solani TaxID=456999 RepID=A0A8H3CJ74_9AGAM|nr:unnamed protein product [Rhizoctonia solani]
MDSVSWIPSQGDDLVASMGFTFQSDCNAPFFEFPIFKSQVYTGGSPGPDRVVIGSVNGEDAAFCGLITHTGAAGRNGFLQCQAA